MTKNKEQWYTTQWGDFQVEETRWGTWRSYDKDGKGLVTGGTEEAILRVTPFHLQCQVEGYFAEERGNPSLLS